MCPARLEAANQQHCFIVAQQAYWLTDADEINSLGIDILDKSLRVRYPDLRFSLFCSRIVKHFPDSGFLNVKFCCFSSSMGFGPLSWTTEAIWRHHFWLFGLSRWRPLASTRPSKYEGVLEGVGLIFTLLHLARNVKHKTSDSVPQPRSRLSTTDMNSIIAPVLLFIV